MSKIIPRYEFRTFAQNFGMVETKMRKLSSCSMIRESQEVYIVSAANNENNTKIRDLKMDIKELVEVKQDLERWNPRLKGEFPMQIDVIRDEIAQLLINGAAIQTVAVELEDVNSVLEAKNQNDSPKFSFIDAISEIFVASDFTSHQ